MPNNQQIPRSEIETIQRVSYCSSTIFAPREKTLKIRVSGTTHLVCVMLGKRIDNSLDDMVVQKNY